MPFAKKPSHWINFLRRARSLEASDSQASGIEKNLQETTESLNRIHFNKKSSANNKCRQCGLRWPHKSGPCPAKGLECRKSGKPNHFAKVCRSKGNTTAKPTTSTSYALQKQKRQVRQIMEQPPEQQTSSSDEEYMFILRQSSDKSKTPVVSVTINGVSTEMIVDTGASTNVLDKVTFRKVNESETITLKAPTKRLCRSLSLKRKHNRKAHHQYILRSAKAKETSSSNHGATT